VWHRNADWSALRNHVISLFDTVICLGGGQGSTEEESIAIKLNKKILYKKDFFK